MARKPRISLSGFYHVINRGVEKRDVYLEDEDQERFLEILVEAAELYDFEVHSFCLMSNHYHLLLETKSDNLSLIMRQINSKYSMYFNGKYTRVGHLWQGRFKSWFVYDDKYLFALIKYIELNPVKAGITKKIGEYPWAMSSLNFKLLIFNDELLKQVDFEVGFTDDDAKSVDAIVSATLKLVKNKIVKKEKQPLEAHFEGNGRECGIVHAVKDGYTQVEIAKYLGLSNVAISKIFAIYKTKKILFQKLKEAGVFWSYAKDISYEKADSSLFIEYLLKYGDFDDIQMGFKLFGKRQMKSIWQSNVAINTQFIDLNVMLGRVFFDMDVDGRYFRSMKNERYEKLRMLAS